jgi:hypothetical protein
MYRTFIACALLCACGSEEQIAPTSTVQPEPDEPGPEVAAPPREEVTAYEIHEWGLIDVDLGTQRAELATGPGHAPPAPPPRPRPDPGYGIGAPRKPVLYFHLRDASPSFRFDLTVHLGSVRLMEHWPDGETTQNTVRWQDVGLRREHCAGGPYPTASDARCQNLSDGYCEVAELASYVTNDSGCLTVGGTEQSLLFYRGEGAIPPLPATIERGPDGTVQVTNGSLAAGAPVLRLLRTRAGGPIHVAMAQLPAVAASVSIPRPSELAADAHRTAIREQLRALGMTQSESEAFERAWFGELFDGAAPTPHGFADAVLFFLPDGAANDYARIEATPPPAAVRRAMAVRAGWSQ